MSPSEVEAPVIWIEQTPTTEPDEPGDAEAWSGEWTEYYAGRPSCQDRFSVRVVGGELDLSSSDCESENPYVITELRWDGQTLRFTAEPSGGGHVLRYEVALESPGQIRGTANGTTITWSKTSD